MSEKFYSLNEGICAVAPEKESLLKNIKNFDEKIMRTASGKRILSLLFGA